MWPIALLVFACCVWGAYLLVGRLMGPRLTVAERLTYYSETFRGRPAAARRWSEIPTADRVMARLNLSRSLEHFLDQADVAMKPFEFVLIMAVAVLSLSVLSLLLSRNPALVPLMGSTGLLVPLAWVRLRRLGRRASFTRQLPDALQTISNSLRAGYGFTQGMTVVATDLPAPISVEFARALREMNLGSTVEEVLRHMARRMPIVDFDLAVSGILINRQVGGNLAELLDHITATIRERVKLKNFIRVLTAQQRISAIIITAVPPIILVALLVGMREYTSYLVLTTIGRVLLAVAVFMQLLGAYFIRRIVAIDV